MIGQARQRTSNIRLDELCTFRNGGTPSKTETSYWSGTIPWITSAEIQDGTILQPRHHVTEYAIDERSSFIAPPNTLLIVIRTGVGKAALTTYSTTFNQDIVAVLPNSERLDLRYLTHFVATQQHHFDRYSRGATVRGITRDDLGAIAVPLPYPDDPAKSLSEQRRIAAILDKADSIRRKRSALFDQCSALSLSTFHRMFAEALTNAPRQMLRDSIDEFRYGTSEKSTESGHPTLRIPNVVRCNIDLADLKNVPVDDAEFARLRLRTGDLLFVRTNGNPDNVGRAAVFDEEAIRVQGHDPSKFIYASYLIRARLKPQTNDPHFIHFFLQTDEGKAQLRERSRTSAGQYNINTDALGNLSIPSVDYAMQKEFAARSHRITVASARMTEASVESNNLFESLVQRAFRGEL